MLKKFFKVKVVAMILALRLVFGVVMVSASGFSFSSSKIEKIETKGEPNNVVEKKPFTYSLLVEALNQFQLWHYVYLNDTWYLVDSDDGDGTILDQRLIVTGDTFFVYDQYLSDELLELAATYETPVVFFQFDGEYDDEIADTDVYINGKKLMYGDYSWLDLGEGRTYLYVVTEPLEE